MAGKLGQFWHELKRRRVIHVITVYATSAFVIIELVNNLVEPLNLPERLPTIVIIVLAVGFPLTVILSWIYDLTSRGVERTKPLDEISEGEKPPVPNAWKIATFVSFIVIIGLVTLNILTGGKQLKAGDIRSLVILPFENYTGNEELEYFVAGLHSSLISDMGRLSGLRVISHQTSSASRFADMSATEIAKELNVDAVVEAAVMCLGDNICFSAQVIGGFPEEKQIWTGDYEEEKSQIQNLYNQIIKNVAGEIKLELTTEEERNLARDRQHDPDLIQAVYKGKFYMDQLTQEGIQMGQKFYNEAIAIDPSDPLPYLGLALGYSSAGHISGAEPDAGERAIAYAEKALALDSNLAEAYVVLAARALYTDWDFNLSQRYLKRATDLNPNHPMANYHYGWQTALSGDMDGTIALFNQTIEMEPIDPYYSTNLAGYYHWLGRYEDALTVATESLELNPNSPLNLFVIGCAYAELGSYEKSIEFHQKGLEISTSYKHGLGIAYARAGQREKALEVAFELEQLNYKWFSWGLAELYTVLGDHEKAMYWVEDAYKQRHDFIPWFNTAAYLKPLQENPRFQEIVQSLNLPV